MGKPTCVTILTLDSFHISEILLLKNIYQYICIGIVNGKHGKRFSSSLFYICSNLYQPRDKISIHFKNAIQLI